MPVKREQLSNNELKGQAPSAGASSSRICASTRRALAALANAPDAFGQTWHLPCCDDRPTYRQFVGMAAEMFGRKAAYTVIGPWTLASAALFSSRVREIRELLPRCAHDNLFDSTRFKRRFPEFGVATYREGLERIRRGWAGR